MLHIYVTGNHGAEYISRVCFGDLRPNGQIPIYLQNTSVGKIPITFHSNTHDLYLADYIIHIISSTTPTTENYESRLGTPTVTVVDHHQPTDYNVFTEPDISIRCNWRLESPILTIIKLETGINDVVLLEGEPRLPPVIGERMLPLLVN